MDNVDKTVYKQKAKQIMASRAGGYQQTKGKTMWTMWTKGFYKTYIVQSDKDVL